jgi:hypothetical protein
MRQRHFAGEKLFVDYAGPTVPIYGRSGDEVLRAHLFVGALGASGYAYAEATRGEALPDWLGAHVRAFEYYGAVPQILVPDNPRVGVTKADRYEPQLQRSYEELAGHYGAVVIPARPYRPKDKAKAELTVQLVERWILARLRHQRFFSLEELNAAIVPLLSDLNARPFQKLPGSRLSVFEALDRPAMRALPTTPYVYAEWKAVRVAFDYHIEIERHYYSVPHALAGHEVWARYGARTVEILHRGVRVASHLRSYQRGGYTTDAGAHARRASGACRVDAEAPHRLGRLDRGGHGRGGRAPAGDEAASRAGLPGLPRAAGAGAQLRRGAAGSGEPARARAAEPATRDREVDPRERSRPASPGRDRGARPADARQRARPRLLPLT